MDAMLNVKPGPAPAMVLEQTRQRASSGAKTWHRMAIAATVAAALGAGVFLASQPRPAFALVTVAAAVERGQTLTFTLHPTGDGSRPPPVTRMMFKGDRYRQESGDIITIGDRVAGFEISLNQSAKTAARAYRRSSAIDVVKLVRELSDRVHDRLPSRQIAGVEAVGFEGVVPDAVFPVNWRTKVWVDPATQLPLRIEMQDAKDVATGLTLEDLRFDDPIADELFKTAVPADYRDVGQVGVPENALRPAATTRESDAFTLRPAVGVGDVRFGMTRDEVVTLLGEPETSLNESETVEYPSRGLTLQFESDGKLGWISAASKAHMVIYNIRDFPGRTDKGIRMGSTQEELIAAYGQPSQSSSDRLDYQTLGMRVWLTDGKVGRITLSAVSR